MKACLLTLFTFLLTFNSNTQVADRLYKPNNTLVDTVNVGIVTVTTNPSGSQQPSMYSVNKNLLKWNTSQIRGLRDTILNTATWNNITGKPSFATVATTGDYNSLINKPNLNLYYLASNPSGYISGINSSMVISALGYTPYNGTVNPLGFITNETDPTVPSYAKSLNSFSVIKASTDPLYKSVSYTPSNSEVITAIGYTPYNGATNPNGYITGYTETDPIYSASSWFSTTNNSTNWNTAYSWGNHAGLYPLLLGSYSNPSWVSSLTWSKITGTPTTLAGYGITDGATATDLSGKENTIVAGTVSQYWRGDKTWQTLDKTAVGLSNVDNTSDANKPISTATATALSGKEPIISAGTTLQYWRGDKSWQTLNTAVVPESGNLYYTDARARAAISVTTTGSGAASYNSSTGVINIPTGGSGTVTNVSSTSGDLTVSNPTTTPTLTIVSAPKLTTARTIQGVSFDGSANINIINGTGFVKVSGTTISYDNNTYLTTNQTITLSGDVTGSGSTAITTTLANSGVTAGTYNGSYTVNAKGLITSASNTTINSNVARSLSNAAGSTNQFTISTTKNARVYYSVNVSWNITALVSTSSTILLEYSTDGGSNWIIANQVSKNINLGLLQSGNDDLNVSGEIPANALVRIRPSVASSATITYVRGQEVLY